MIKGSRMRQEERWLKRYKEVMDFMEKKQRRPSRDRILFLILRGMVRSTSYDDIKCCVGPR